MWSKTNVDHIVSIDFSHFVADFSVNPGFVVKANINLKKENPK